MDFLPINNVQNDNDRLLYTESFMIPHNQSPNNSLSFNTQQLNFPSDENQLLISNQISLVSKADQKHLVTPEDQVRHQIDSYINRKSFNTSNKSPFLEVNRSSAQLKSSPQNNKSAMLESDVHQIALNNHSLINEIKQSSNEVERVSIPVQELQLNLFGLEDVQNVKVSKIIPLRRNLEQSSVQIVMDSKIIQNRNSQILNIPQQDQQYIQKPREVRISRNIQKVTIPQIIKETEHQYLLNSYALNQNNRNFLQISSFQSISQNISIKNKQILTRKLKPIQNNPNLIVHGQNNNSIPLDRTLTQIQAQFQNMPEYKKSYLNRNLSHKKFQQKELVLNTQAYDHEQIGSKISTSLKRNLYSKSYQPHPIIYFDSEIQEQLNNNRKQLQKRSLLKNNQIFTQKINQSKMISLDGEQQQYLIKKRQKILLNRAIKPQSYIQEQNNIVFAEPQQFNQISHQQFKNEIILIDQNIEYISKPKTIFSQKRDLKQLSLQNNIKQQTVSDKIIQQQEKIFQELNIPAYQQQEYFKGRPTKICMKRNLIKEIVHEKLVDSALKQTSQGWDPQKKVFSLFKIQRNNIPSEPISFCKNRINTIRSK